MWKTLLVITLGTLASLAPSVRAQEPAFPVPQIPYAPLSYVAGRTSVTPQIDGSLDDPVWQAASWTDPFVDITGSTAKAPRFATQAALAWDDSCLYIAARLEEPDLWATYTRRDMVVFHENDFEVFIDPDGDTHNYYEVEMNALNTVWDLLLLKPYRDGGPAVDNLDLKGMRTAVHLDGTINDPSDRDAGWSLEMALPWSDLEECAGTAAPPHPGDRWRINFSRVEWQLDNLDGLYIKRTDPKTGNLLPEDNWTWSPQGLIAMHYPEMWGYVQFSDASAGRTPAFTPDPGDEARWTLRQVYYAEMEHHDRTGAFGGLDALDGSGASELLPSIPGGWHLAIDSTPGGYVASLSHGGTSWRIREDGQVRLVD